MYAFDACSADGYVQNIYTIPVGAYSEDGSPADYDERCSAKMTVAFVANKQSYDLDVVCLSQYTTRKIHIEFYRQPPPSPIAIMVNVLIPLVVLVLLHHMYQQLLLLPWMPSNAHAHVHIFIFRAFTVLL